MFKKNKSTRELIGVVDIGNVSINTEHGELVYFSLEPTNIGVLSEDSINIKVEQLMNVLGTTSCLQKFFVHTKKYATKRENATNA